MDLCRTFSSLNSILGFDIFGNSRENISRRLENGQIRPLDLLFAVKNNDIELTERLCEQGADVNVIDVENRSALYFAVEKRNLTLMKILLECGAKIEILNDEDPFFSRISKIYLEIIRSKNLDIVSVSLEYGANPSYLLEYALFLFTTPKVIDSTFNKLARYFKPIFKYFIDEEKISPQYLFDINKKEHYEIIDLLLVKQPLLRENINIEVSIKRIMIFGSLHFCQILLKKSAIRIFKKFTDLLTYTALNADVNVLKYFYKSRCFDELTIYKSLSQAIETNRYGAIRYLLNTLNLDKLDVFLYYCLLCFLSTLTNENNKSKRLVLQQLAKYKVLRATRGRTGLDWVFNEALREFDRKQRMYYNKCLVELNSMKTHYVFENVSVFDLITHSTNIKWWRNKKNVIAFRKLCTARKFPCYSDHMLEFLYNIRESEATFLRARKRLNRMLRFKDFSLHVVTEKILDHLTYLDLTCLLYA